VPNLRSAMQLWLPHPPAGSISTVTQTTVWSTTNTSRRVGARLRDVTPMRGVISARRQESRCSHRHAAASASDRIAAAWLTASSASRRSACTPARFPDAATARAPRRSTRPPRSSSTPRTTRRAFSTCRRLQRLLAHLPSHGGGVRGADGGCRGRALGPCRGDRTGGGSNRDSDAMSSAGDHIVSGVDPLRRYAHAASREPQKLGIETTLSTPDNPDDFRKL